MNDTWADSLFAWKVYVNIENGSHEPFGRPVKIVINKESINLPTHKKRINNIGIFLSR